MVLVIPHYTVYWTNRKDLERKKKTYNGLHKIHE